VYFLSNPPPQNPIVSIILLDRGYLYLYIKYYGGFIYTGADLIADFIALKLYPNVFLVTGGACAFMVDALGRHSTTKFTCFQHEQSAAMAADAIWRITGKVGVTMATSGPGATNLITGIACSWFDSIPSFHITGQVNQSESRESLGAEVRQAGFQETDIVGMVKPITKWAHKVESIDDLVESLDLALIKASTGRMGPVLLDIPMNIQKEFVSEDQKRIALQNKSKTSDTNSKANPTLKNFLSDSDRPLVIIGAGLALSSGAKETQNWCESFGIPYVATWGAISYLDRSKNGYLGTIGVYGSRLANWCVQSADKIVVLGSRLDNRQRTGNPNGFAPYAKILVFDVDLEELKKYKIHNNYKTVEFNLKESQILLNEAMKNYKDSNWQIQISNIKKEINNGFESSVNSGELNPYTAVQKIQNKFQANAIVVSDCGANLCWVYQPYQPDSSYLFTAGGNSPMGYSLPAAIGAQISNPQKTIYCFIGDGGLQMNIQELQTLVNYNLPIKIIIQNNFGYGIIKQFQDAYFGGRYFATGEGYSQPDFKKIADAYGISYLKITNENELDNLKFEGKAEIIDLHFSPNSLITPKTEMDRFIHDQFPYPKDNSIRLLPYDYPSNPSKLGGISASTV
jgi:acetolactate synthase-1/2/3 large subunit